MISPRQRLRPDAEVPVLFSLPNLHTRRSGFTTEPNHQTLHAEAPQAAAFEPIPVDSLASTTPAEIPSIATHSEVRHESAAASHPVPAAVPTSRSWMERVGSRLILAGTLLVIVTAAWLTGRQMPASKPEPWSDSTPVEPEVATATKGHQTPAFATADEKSVHAAQLAAADSAATATPHSTPAPALPTATVAANNTASTWTTDSQSPTSVFKTQVQPADAAASPVFNTVSLQSAANSAEPAAPPHQSESIPLAPPLTATPPMDAAPATESASVQGPDKQTSTPHAPAVDPNVLLPWFNEQAKAPPHRQSATPNAITDWSKYLPDGANGQQTIRAVSSSEPLGTPVRAQQAAVPQGVITNPYSQ